MNTSYEQNKATEGGGGGVNLFNWSSTLLLLALSSPWILLLLQYKIV